MTTTTTTAPPAKAERRVLFDKDAAFHHDLRRAVDLYFRISGRRRYDLPQMYLKVAIILLWTVASYVGTVFYAQNWWQVLIGIVSLAFASAAIGFNLQHDGGHRAASRHPWVNRWLARTLDLVGGSSYLWNYKHNSLHHTYANIMDHDDDIDVGIFGRFSPHQKHLFFHRLQHFYMWFLYGFLALKWQLLDDFMTVRRGTIGSHRIPRPKGTDLAIFILGKALFYSLALGIPILVHLEHWWIPILGYIGVALIQGFIISTVFQLAHVVEDAEFPEAVEAPDRMDRHWAAHQVLTTVDFAPRSRLLSWYVGGLNYQVEHHLFPRLCHVHYPRISRLVSRVCERHGLPHHVQPTLRGALASHFRLLRRLGQPNPA